MACTAREEIDSLQAALDFISGYDHSPIDNHSVSAMLDLIGTDGALFDLDQEDLSWKDEASLTVQDHKSSDKEVSSTNQIDITSLVASAPWPKVATSPTKRRRRGVPRKEEIAELRKIANELSNQLQSLKRASTKVAEAELKQNEASNALAMRLWREIASRQLRLRNEAAETNAKLRDDVVAQVKCAANLKRMLKRRYCDEMLELMPIEKRGRKVSSQTFIDNERIFKELLQGTDSIYTGVDALFAKKNLDQVPCPGRTQEAFPDAVNGLYLELLDKNQVPFGTFTTADAVWRALRGRKTSDGEIVKAKICAQDTQQTDDVTTVYTHYACSAAGHSSFVKERRIARRYVEENRVVFVCRGLTEPSSRSLGSLGLLFRETIIIVVRAGQPLVSGGETALIENYLWVTRCDEGKEATRMFRDETYMDLAIRGWNSKLSLNNERIENILFDDARTQLK